MPIIVIPEYTALAGRQREVCRVDMAHGTAEAAHLLRREDPVPVVAFATAVEIEEAAGVVAGFRFVAPRRRTLEQLQFGVAGLKIREDRRARAQVVGQGPDEIDGVIFGFDRAIADCAFAAAIGAELSA